tara:strand:+ start:5937 stop:6062 length:126 start_codon:yes stop_codon:yes gene_type:complete
MPFVAWEGQTHAVMLLKLERRSLRAVAETWQCLQAVAAAAA